MLILSLYTAVKLAFFKRELSFLLKGNSTSLTFSAESIKTLLSAKGVDFMDISLCRTESGRILAPFAGAGKKH